MTLDKTTEDDLIYRLRKRAEIRRNIAHRKSVQEGKPDRIADLLEESADAIEELLKDSDLHEKNKSTNSSERTPCSHTQSRPSLVEVAIMRPELLPPSLRKWRAYRIEYGYECSCPEGFIYLSPEADAQAIERELNKHAKNYDSEEGSPF